MVDYTLKIFIHYVLTFVSHSFSIKHPITKIHDMQRIEHFTNRTRLFLFDLEFIGDVKNLNTCKIWEIAIFSISSNEWFVSVIDPDPKMDTFPKPPIPEIPRLQRTFLQEENAILWDEAFQKMSTWVSTQLNAGDIPVFISHNTFRADKPIMELECKRYNIRIPLNWYFFDSLHFSRAVIRNSAGNYSLSGLHTQLFDKPIENVHRAKYDVIACNNIMSKLTKNTWNLTGPMYPAYMTSLRSIRWVGRKAEELFYNANIRSVEDLYVHLQTNIQLNYIQMGTDEETSIYNALVALLQHDLPTDNITNIVRVIMDKRRTKPFSYTFMITND